MLPVNNQITATIAYPDEKAILDTYDNINLIVVDGRELVSLIKWEAFDELVKSALQQIENFEGQKFIEPLENLRNKMIKDRCFGKDGEDLVIRINKALCKLCPALGTLLVDLTAQIIDSLYLSCNKWKFYRHSEFQALACVSKQWNVLANMAKKNCRAEHHNLQAQGLAFSTKLKQRTFTTAEKAVEFIIAEHADEQILDLRDFPELTEKCLDKLLQGCPKIEHLMIRSNLIKALPEVCSRLQTLICSSCQQLTTLPCYMPDLSWLECSGCSRLSNLPNYMPFLTFLDCSNCTSVNELPLEMTKLTSLDCHGCIGLNELPLYMSRLTSLDCHGCKALTTLPDSLPQLSNLQCMSCEQLTALPNNMPQLFKLNCGYCWELTTLSANIPMLTYLACSYCPKLTLPSNLDMGKLIQCVLPKHLHHLQNIKIQVLVQSLKSIGASNTTVSRIEQILNFTPLSNIQNQTIDDDNHMDINESKSEMNSNKRPATTQAEGESELKKPRHNLKGL